MLSGIQQPVVFWCCLSRLSMYSCHSYTPTLAPDWASWNLWFYLFDQYDWIPRHQRYPTENGELVRPYLLVEKENIPFGRQW